MSSDVQPKCTSSSTAGVAPFAASFSRTKYSTAFTSWLMRLSMAFTAAGASSPGSSARPAASCFTASASGSLRICGTDSASDSSQAASMRTRSRIRPLSDSTARNGSAPLR